MSKATYWITTTNGIHAQVEGVEERDRWLPLGWQEVDEPAPTDFVWMRKEGLELPAQFAYGASETWQQMGWEYSAPPPPVDVTKDPLLFDQPKLSFKKPSRAKTTEPADAVANDKPALAADDKN